jgi:two-component system CheB/CheR fusion protein
MLDSEVGEAVPINLEHLAERVIANVHEEEYEARGKTGRWYSMRVCPYMALENKIDDATLVLVDIDDLVRSRQTIIYLHDSAENTIGALPMPPLVLDSRLQVEHVNRAFYHTFRIMAAETVDWFIYDLGNGQWNIRCLRELLEKILPQSRAFEDFEVVLDLDSPGPLGRACAWLEQARPSTEIRADTADHRGYHRARAGGRCAARK